MEGRRGQHASGEHVCSNSWLASVTPGPLEAAWVPRFGIEWGRCRRRGCPHLPLADRRPLCLDGNPRRALPPGGRLVHAGRGDGQQGADLAGSRDRVSDPLPGPRAGRPHREALTPPFTHGETEAQRHHFLCAQQVVTGPREAAAVCCLFVLSLILSFGRHYLPGDAKPGAGWQLVTVRSGGSHWALLTAAVLRARLRGPKARGAAGASPGDGSARCCDVRQVS